jgi:hypothetical protein
MRVGQGGQGSAPLMFGKPLNGATLDDSVEWTWAQRNVQQVADDEFNAPTRPMELRITKMTEAMRIGLRRVCLS